MQRIFHLQSLHRYRNLYREVQDGAMSIGRLESAQCLATPLECPASLSELETPLSKPDWKIEEALIALL
jgi:hypothetical protein